MRGYEYNMRMLTHSYLCVQLENTWFHFIVFSFITVKGTALFLPTQTSLHTLHLFPSPPKTHIFQSLKKERHDFSLATGSSGVGQRGWFLNARNHLAFFPSHGSLLCMPRLQTCFSAMVSYLCPISTARGTFIAFRHSALTWYEKVRVNFCHQFASYLLSEIPVTIS